MPTGYGKSAAYRIAGAMLPGTTLIVSPLIALQADQLAHLAETPGTRPAALVNSNQSASRTAEAWERLPSRAPRHPFPPPGPPPQQGGGGPPGPAPLCPAPRPAGRPPP